jgi:hypothetical protein
MAFELWGLGIGPRQEVVDLAGAVSLDDPCKRVGEIGVGIDVVKLAGIDHRGNDRPASLPVRPGQRDEKPEREAGFRF